MDVQRMIGVSLEANRIRELYLYNLPVLKTVDNWNDVKEVGRIDFRGKRVNYAGGLCEYMGKVYFVPDQRIIALSRFRKWNFKTTIQVVPEKEWKKKVTDFHAKQKK